MKSGRRGRPDEERKRPILSETERAMCGRGEVVVTRERRRRLQAMADILRADIQKICITELKSRFEI